MVTINGRDYNVNDYNASTNPGGFGAGGHREKYATGLAINYLQALVDTIADGTNSLQTTSTTTNSFSVGSKSWVMAEVRPFLVGQNVRIIDQDTAGQFMTGEVTGWVEGTKTLTINVTKVSGSGSSSNWKSSLDGAVGATGSLSIADLQNLLSVYVTSTGSANAYVLTPGTALGAYTNGSRFYMLANFTNTGAATVNVSGLGAKNIYWQGAALSGNEIESGNAYILAYNGTEFDIISPINQLATQSQQLIYNYVMGSF